MRKFVISGLIGAAMLIGIPSIAHAQISFLFGLGMGYVLSSGETHLSGGNGPSVLYLMPRGAERVTDPLSMRQTATNCYDVGWNGAGKTIRESFAAAVKDSERYEIVQVVRASSASNTGCLLYWITYIDKERVISLEKLPPLAENKK